MIGMKLNYRYWTKSKGIKGRLEREEDFVVREQIDQQFLKRFKRTENGINQMHGRYFIFLLKKKSLLKPACIHSINLSMLLEVY